MQKQLDKTTKKQEELTEKLYKQAESHAERVLTLEAKMSKVNSENAELKQKYEEVCFRILLFC